MNTTKPGVLVVIASLGAIVRLHEGNRDAAVNEVLEQADEAIATVERMAACLDRLAERDTDSPTHNEALAALAAFRGEA